MRRHMAEAVERATKLEKENKELRKMLTSFEAGEMQEAMMAHMKSSLTNTKVSWTGYKDCPFFPKKLEQEYRTITGSGWYHKMYQFMVSVSFNAIRSGYPISDIELEKLARELDLQTGNWYEKRPILGEANSALNYAYKNSEV